MPITEKTPKEKVISDFVHSDDPKFDKDSKKERIRRALGAYYGMHKEEVELGESLTYKQKLANITVYTDWNKAGGMQKSFGHDKDLSDDSHYTKAVADANAYAKTLPGKPDVRHVDHRGHVVRGGSVAKVRRDMKEEVTTIDELIEEFTSWCTDDLLESNELGSVVDFINTHKEAYVVGTKYIPVTLIANPKINYMKLSIGSIGGELVSSDQKSYVLKTVSGNRTYPYGQHKGAVLDTLLFKSKTAIDHFKTLFMLKFSGEYQIMTSKLSENVDFSSIVKDRLKQKGQTMLDPMTPEERAARDKRNAENKQRPRPVDPTADRDYVDPRSNRAVRGESVEMMDEGSEGLTRQEVEARKQGGFIKAHDFFKQHEGKSKEELKQILKDRTKQFKKPEE
jgi:hypothetical protein